ncbi:MAG: hypothetical protein ABJL55_19020 [Roseibium sp.]
MTAIDGTAALGSGVRTPDISVVPPALPPQLRQPNTIQADTDESSFGFADFIDVINPMQHIPGVAEVYRAITQDQISDQARKTGNTLYGIVLGGPIGLGAMLAYNALGDRLAAANKTLQTASDHNSIAEMELPGPIPNRAAEARKLPDGVETHIRDKAGKPPILGHEVASTGTIKPGAPLDLANVLRGERAAQNVSLKPPEHSIGQQSNEASSIAYVELKESSLKPDPVMPDKVGLDRLATHKSNHLPLDVLKVMQERHAQRTASQQS